MLMMIILFTIIIIIVTNIESSSLSYYSTIIIVFAYSYVLLIEYLVQFRDVKEFPSFQVFKDLTSVLNHHL